jgi:hypothetical protein
MRSSFITNIYSGYIPPGKAIELINQIYEITKSESVPPPPRLITKLCQREIRRKTKD